MKTSRDLVNNILEMLMCLWFQSLPLPRLRAFLGEHETFATTGLNLIIPLLQGVRLSDSERQAYRLELGSSEDPEIRMFIEARETALAKRPTKRPTKRPVTRPRCEDYNQALREAVESIPHLKNLSLSFPGECPVLKDAGAGLDIQSVLQVAASKLAELTNEPVSLVLPFGSPKARIGFVLDYDIVTPSESSSTTALPYSLQAAGFNDENSLIWPFNFQQDCLTSSGRVQHSTSEREVLVSLNQEVVRESDLRVIIVCGPNASCVLPPTCQQTEVKIGDLSYDAFLEIHESNIERIYLNSSVPISSLHSTRWHHTLKVSVLLKFASSITHTPGIWWAFFVTKAPLKYMVLRRSHERNGHEQMTPKTMPPSVESWLHNKGFKTERDFDRITNIGGTFTQGVLLAMITAPHCPEEHRSRTPTERAIPHPAVRTRTPVFRKEQLHDMRLLHSQNTSKNDGDFAGTYKGDENSEALPESIGSGDEISQFPVQDDGDSEGELFDDGDSEGELFAEMEDEISEQLDHEMAQKVSEVVAKRRRPSRLENIRKELLGEDSHSLKGERQLLKTGDNRRWILIRWVNIIVPCSDLQITQGKGTTNFNVTVKYSLPGTKHPNAFARDAQDDDPASRIAFRVRSKNTDGSPVTFYPQSTPGQRYPAMRINALHDWLQGESFHQSARKPRRFIAISEEEKEAGLAMNLDRFVGKGCLTDDGYSFRDDSQPKVGRREEDKDTKKRTIDGRGDISDPGPSKSSKRLKESHP